MYEQRFLRQAKAQGGARIKAFGDFPRNNAFVICECFDYDLTVTQATSLPSWFLQSGDLQAE